MGCRILFLVGQLGTGGLERQLYYLVQAMSSHRYKPAVVVWNYSRSDHHARLMRALGVPLYLVGHSSRREKLRRLRGLVNALKPEVLHSYSFFTNFAAWWASCGTGTISVGSIRNDFISDCREAGSVLGRLSARWPTTQICNSIAAQMAVERTTGPFRPSRLHLVPNGLDLNRFDPTVPLPRVPLVLAIGRLHPSKRWDRLVGAVAHAKDKGLTFLVQHAGEGPLRHALEAQAKHAGVDHLVTFLGERHDVPHLLARATVLVHTADEEGCPNVIMEAMASGRAVVATDAGHSPYLVEDGQTGFLVKRGDEALLAERVCTVIEDRDLAVRMGQAGRATMEQKFGLRQLLQETLRAYGDAGWKG